MSIEWNDCLLLDHEPMDEDHRRMAALINKLYLSVSDDFGKEAVCRAALDLLEFTRGHFSHERELMVRNDYPDAVAHLGQHQQLLDRLASLISDLEGSDTPADPGTVEFIDAWFTVHLKESDSKLAVHLNRFAPQEGGRAGG